MPQKKKLLILDLDETLVFSTRTPLEHPPDHQVEPYWVYARPFLADFLQQTSRHFELAVWSSGSDDYVAAIVHKVFPKDISLSFVWGRSRCTTGYLHDEQFLGPHAPSTPVFYKKLKKVRRRGYDLNRILIVDNTPRKVKHNYGNAVYAREFTGDPADRELPLLARYLESLRNVENVRMIEKRGWWNRVKDVM